MKELNKLVGDLMPISAVRIYSEFFICVIVYWVSFAIFNMAGSSIVLVTSFLISTVFLFRGLSFIHEVSHLTKRLPRFKQVYNLFFGFPFRVPAYSMKTHRYHHGVKTFGGAGDPEYEAWTEKPAYFLLRPLILSFFYPVILALRFGVWPLIVPFLGDEMMQKTYRHFSAFVMNLKYLRPFHENDYQDMRREDRLCALFFWSILGALFWFGVAKQVALLWYSQFVIISVLNTYRALVAHRYCVHRKKISGMAAQLSDSVTIEGGLLTEIWAPINLRYHSTHHLFPSLPYYNLAKAHRRLMAELPENHPYRDSVEPSFFTAMVKLIASCRSGGLNFRLAR